jgi:hypothetical protein
MHFKNHHTPVPLRKASALAIKAFVSVEEG